MLTAFAGDRRIASGSMAEVALAAAVVARRTGNQATILAFDDRTGRQVELDLRGTGDQISARLLPSGPPTQAAARRTMPGRPRLGVVSREVTLLPRHWEWLGKQPGGASVTLRKLVDGARKTSAAFDLSRSAKEATDRVMAVLAGNRPGYEEASRALYAGDRLRFEAHTAAWPPDVREYARGLAAPAFGETEQAHAGERTSRTP